MIVYVEALKSITRTFISLIALASSRISESPSCYSKAAEKELAGRLFKSV